MEQRVLTRYGNKLNYFLLATIMLITSFALSAGPPQTIGQVAENIASNFENIGKLMIGVAYLSGLGFGIAAVFKFKQCKDNPTQIPIGTPFALLGVSSLLVFLPGLYVPAGETIFGVTEQELNAQSGGFTGKGVCGLPGEDAC